VVEVERFYVDLGRRLRLQRDRKHVTQQQLGSLLDPPTTRASIANIEAGKQRVLAHTLVQLAHALGLSISELLPPIETNRRTNIREELRQKLPLPDKQLRRVVEKLAPAKGGRDK
jgi:transcriptional regulator with XRE-family HTH domain